MIDKNRLKSKSNNYNIDLNSNMLDRLEQYATMLVEWSKVMNLTAIKDAEGIEDKHFIDSLLFASNIEKPGSLIDVGTGAGFPGIVAKILRPELDVSLLEPTGKRVNFLKAVKEELNIDINIINDRAELISKGENREKYDIVTARAVAGLSILCEYCLPLAKIGGVFIPMKSEAADEEVIQAQTAIKTLGGVYDKTREFILPDGSKRKLIYINKQKHTPDKYPRNSGRITKQPL